MLSSVSARSSGRRKVGITTEKCGTARPLSSAPSMAGRNITASGALIPASTASVPPFRRPGCTRNRAQANLQRGWLSPAGRRSQAGFPVTVSGYHHAAEREASAGVCRRLTRVPSLSVVLPAYNEAENIERSVTSALEALPDLAEDFEVIVVNDGSTDE